MKDFRQLKVWEKSHQLALAVYKATKDFPKEELYGLTSQIRRSSIELLLKNYHNREDFAERHSCRFRLRNKFRATDGLRKAGNPIPENDIWIAAIALQHGLTPATRDKHFQSVDNLKIQMW